jgi:flagellar biosynthesis GTPase FlhF
MLTQRKPTPKSGNRKRFGHDDLLADVFQHLLSQEVNRDIANDIINALTHKYPDKRFDSITEVSSKMAEVLRHKRNGAKSRLNANPDSQVLAVVGPTGVGKTTTVAKLAARHAIELEKKVALISLDSYRIGAAAQLKVYAKAIGIPVKTAGTAAAFKAAVNEFREFDLILVDTPGVNPEKQNEIEDLKACLECIESIEIHLVLSAGAKESDLFRILERLKALAVRYLIFTKLDESGTLGSLINLMMQLPLPLSFLTSGRQVPDGIETGSFEKMVERLLGGFKNHKALSKSGEPEQSTLQASDRLAGSYYVANKNSDVFHRPDCKWTEKIKSKNMVTFLSVQDATIRHFMPCRDCQPAHSDTSQAGLSTRGKVRISKYS